MSRRLMPEALLGRLMTLRDVEDYTRLSELPRRNAPGDARLRVQGD